MACILSLVERIQLKILHEYRIQNTLLSLVQNRKYIELTQ